VLLNWLTVPELHREMCKLNQSLGRQGHDFAVIFPFTSLKCTSEDHQGREEGNANLKVLLQMPTYFTQGQEVERVFAALFLLPSSLSLFVQVDPVNNEDWFHVTMRLLRQCGEPLLDMHQVKHSRL
jgi:hypothetical protein